MSARWDDRCTDILTRMVRGGYTDREIADHIAARLGLRFHRNTVMAQRHARQLGPCWEAWSRRRPRVYAAA